MKTILGIFSVLFIAVFAAFFSTDAAQPAPPFNPSASKYVVAQFNASWNSAPNVTGFETAKWYVYNQVDISKDMQAKSKHKISTLPTVIFFKDGKEVKRWEAGVGMKATFTAQQINAEIQRLK
jgi:hypothetical protein